jgi:oligopeptide transport system permease protein
MRYYLLGTDDLGRDVLSRTIYGGQISMLVGVLGALFSVLIGIVIGAIAGYVGGRVDYFIMRFIEVLYGLPYMLLVIILMAIFGNNPINLFVALALVSWLTEAQVVRGQVISLKNSEFVEAAKSVGASTGRIIFRHLLPNTIGIIIVFATLRVPTFIMSESFLSYLGLGISAPAASWGSLIKDGVDSMQMYPWRLLVPATAMTLFLFFMNFLGDGLRDAFDPQSKQK